MYVDGLEREARLKGLSNRRCMIVEFSRPNEGDQPHVNHGFWPPLKKLYTDEIGSSEMSCLNLSCNGHTCGQVFGRGAAEVEQSRLPYRTIAARSIIPSGITARWDD